MEKKYNIAIVGATGLVGRKMLEVVMERNFPIAQLRLFASEKSAGKIINYENNEFIVEDLAASDISGFDFALFSAGKTCSMEFAPKFAQTGCVVIDNSSCWRMYPEVPLVVPEVNPQDAFLNKGIIANPNCSTIQLAVALNPLHKKYKIKQIIVSTYQSISGAGQKAVDQLNDELSNREVRKRITKHKVLFNALFHEKSDEMKGFTVEEVKIMNEMRKILHHNEMLISATCVRLPILGGHGEAVNIVFEKPFEINDIINTLNEEKNIIIIDDIDNEDYPTPQISNNKDEVFVGRIRKDLNFENGLYLWVVSDNVRKGAATNAVQIAELLINGK